VGKDIKELKIITCHLGNGASLSRLVRVVVSPQGSILKITTSK
jgi:acetate kinase